MPHHVLLILLLAVSVAIASALRDCNAGTEYHCLCTSNISDKLHNLQHCHDFIKRRELSVVDLRMRHVNLKAKLYTHETYEAYFKRRIAELVSSYCQDHGNECLGTTLRLPKTTSSTELADEQSVLYATDENEPLLTQDNVVLLQVDNEPRNVTRVLFAITKSPNSGPIDKDDVVDPQKIKYILGSQTAPLARILGGIKIENIRVSTIHRELSPAETDNSRLKIIIAIVASFFIICYIIGAIKCYRDCQRKKEARVRAKCVEEVTPLKSYGTCANGGKDQSQLHGNGNALSNNCTSLDDSYKKIDEFVDYYQRETPVLSDRQARRMFMCDPSQLPREPTFEEPPATEAETTSARSSTSPPKTSIRSRQSSAESEKQTMNVPALVLQPSNSIQCDTPSSVAEATNENIVQLAPTSDSPILARPHSRRGSYVEGELLDLPEIPVPIPATESLPNDDHWSSSEGEVEVYYKLSDDEDIKGDDWGAAHQQHKSPTQHESDSEEEPPEDEHVDPDNYMYERLREEASPAPEQLHDA